jgi:hypothetical protein
LVPHAANIGSAAQVPAQQVATHVATAGSRPASPIKPVPARGTGGGQRAAQGGKTKRPWRAGKGKRLPLSGLGDDKTTNSEQWAMLARSDKKAEKLLRRVEKALEKGNYHAARHLQRHYLGSYHATCGSAREAVRGAKHMGDRLERIQNGLGA